MSNNRDEDDKQSRDKSLDYILKNLHKIDEEYIKDALRTLDDRYKIIEFLVDHYPNQGKLLDKDKCHSKDFDLIKVQNLVLTDLFVERDIQVLSERANRHKKHGNFYYYITMVIFLVGTLLATLRMVTPSYDEFFGLFVSEDTQASTSIGTGTDNADSINDKILELIKNSILSFTAYGLLVLTAVALWKQSKAHLDQAERLYEKTRLNRILRLYIHLNNGEITSDELKQVLALANTDSNAFTSIVAKGKAPIGATFPDFVELVKVMKNEK